MTFEEFLKKQIEKTGYPLEIEVSSRLDKDWDVINTDSYFDKDEGKLRDIDIYASRDFADFFPLVVSASLAIECKKSENFVWVFFTRPFEFDYVNDITGQYIDELQVRSKRFDLDYISEVILEKNPLHYYSMKRVAVSYDEFPIDTKKSEYGEGKKQIFKAENQLKKYLTYSNEQFLLQPPQEVKLIYISFPCIVFDGTMYEAILEDGKVELKKSNHVVLARSNRAPYSVYDLTFLIDVVTKNYFDRYMKKINNDVKSCFDMVRKRKRRILRELEKISWYTLQPDEDFNTCTRFPPNSHRSEQSHLPKTPRGTQRALFRFQGINCSGVTH